MAYLHWLQPVSVLHQSGTLAGVRRQQLVDNIHRTVFGSHVQRSDALIGDVGNIGTNLEQGFHHVGVLGGCSDDQWGDSLRVTCRTEPNVVTTCNQHKRVATANHSKPQHATVGGRT